MTAFPTSRDPGVWASAFLAAPTRDVATVTAWFAAAFAAADAPVTFEFPKLLWAPDGRELTVENQAEQDLAMSHGATLAPVPPVLTALEPATAVLGSPSFTLHVIGTGFQADAVIVFAGHDEPTTVVSATEVTTGVDMTVWAGPDAVPVLVRQGAALVSQALAFTFTVAAPEGAPEAARLTLADDDDADDPPDPPKKRGRR